MGRWLTLRVETASTKNKMFPHEKYELSTSSALNKGGPITFLSWTAPSSSPAKGAEFNKEELAFTTLKKG